MELSNRLATAPLTLGGGEASGTGESGGQRSQRGGKGGGRGGQQRNQDRGAEEIRA
jgi:translation initiation factor 3 subunit F